MAGTDASCPLRFRATRDVLAWWQAARPADGLPGRRAIEPLAFPRALPHVWLCVHDARSADFRYSLSGEEIDAVFGRSLKGRPLAAMFATHASWRAVYETFSRVIREPAVYHGLGCIYRQLGRHRTGERLILPILDDAGTRSAILGVTVYESPAPHKRPVQDYPAPAIGDAPSGPSDPEAWGPADVHENFYPLDAVAAWTVS